MKSDGIQQHGPEEECIIYLNQLNYHSLIDIYQHDGS